MRDQLYQEKSLIVSKVTGALTRGIDIRGIGGVSLSDTWEEGVKTFLGLFVKDFPNMATIMGTYLSRAAGNSRGWRY